MIANRTVLLLGCLMALTSQLAACGTSDASSSEPPETSDATGDTTGDTAGDTAGDVVFATDAPGDWGSSTPDAWAEVVDVETAADASTLEDASPADASEVSLDADVFEVPSGLEVRLAWSSPVSPEPGVDTGATFVDLDLHLRHPFAVDWFDMPFDCFWFNPAPNWGSFDPVVQDDPVLELDSIDGEGSERASIDQPEDGLIYRIGVHAWNDNGQGPTQATVSILIGGQLLYEASLPLKNHDLWEVATVSWPSGEITSVLNEEGDPLVWPEVYGEF